MSQDIYVLGEMHQGAPSDMTLELLAGARQLAAQTGGKVVAVALGPEGSQGAGRLSGADRAVVIDDGALAA